MQFLKEQENKHEVRALKKQFYSMAQAILPESAIVFQNKLCARRNAWREVIL
jgi:hypothetical protein